MFTRPMTAPVVFRSASFAAERSVCLSLQRPEPAALKLHHRRQPDHDSPQYPGTGSTIAPFLRLDHDPYLVISDWQMFWMQDAYTVSSYFPYAQPVQELGLNYIRNSVKVIVDAYNGTVDFYLMDPATRSPRPTSASFRACSSRSRPCRRTCRSTFAIRRTCS